MKKNIIIVFIAILLTGIFSSAYVKSNNTISITFDSKNSHNIEYELTVVTGEDKKHSTEVFAPLSNEFNEATVEIDYVLSSSDDSNVTALKIGTVDNVGSVAIKDVVVGGVKTEIVYPNFPYQHSTVIGEDSVEIIDYDLSDYDIEAKSESYIVYTNLIIVFALIFTCIYFVVACVIGLLNMDASPARVVFVLIIAVLVFTPSLFMNFSEIDERENRTLAEFPSFKDDGGVFNYKITDELSIWYNDHVGFRSNYIKLGDSLEHFVENGKVRKSHFFMGREEWGFFNAPTYDDRLINDGIRDFQRLNVLDENELSVFVDKIARETQYLSKNGIDFYAFIPPDKSSIYGEYYPEGINRSDNPSSLTVVSEMMVEYPVIAEYDYLLNRKSDGYLYYKGDTHWTDLGAYYGYLRIMEEVNKNHPEIATIPLDEFEVNKDYAFNNLSYGHSNDIYTALNYEAKSPVLYSYFEKKSGSYSGNKKDYSVNDYKTVNKNGQKKVLVVGDSYIGALSKYLSSTFAEVEYVRSSDLNTINSMIANGNDDFDIVIYEIVERDLDVMVNGYPDKDDEEEEDE